MNYISLSPNTHKEIQMNQDILEKYFNYSEDLLDIIFNAALQILCSEITRIGLVNIITEDKSNLELAQIHQDIYNKYSSVKDMKMLYATNYIKESFFTLYSDRLNILLRDNLIQQITLVDKKVNKKDTNRLIFYKLYQIFLENNREDMLFNESILSSLDEYSFFFSAKNNLKSSLPVKTLLTEFEVKFNKIHNDKIFDYINSFISAEISEKDLNKDIERFEYRYHKSMKTINESLVRFTPEEIEYCRLYCDNNRLEARNIANVYGFSNRVNSIEFRSVIRLTNNIKEYKISTDIIHLTLEYLRDSNHMIFSLLESNPKYRLTKSIKEILQIKRLQLQLSEVLRKGELCLS